MRARRLLLSRGSCALKVSVLNPIIKMTSESPPKVRDAGQLGPSSPHVCWGCSPKLSPPPPHTIQISLLL